MLMSPKFSLPTVTNGILLSFLLDRGFHARALFFPAVWTAFAARLASTLVTISRESTYGWTASLMI
jgi:hypothetical protein